MTDVTSAAAAMLAAASTFSGQHLTLPGWKPAERDGLVERERLIAQARDTDAARQLRRCFPRWTKALDHLAWRALARLAANEPVDPNDPDVWQSRDEQAHAVLRRHGLTTVKAGRLTMTAVSALVDGQTAADREAGLDWSRLTVPASRLDEPLRRAHARLPIDLADPGVYVHRDDQRRALAERLGLDRRQGRRPVAVGAGLPRRVRPGDLRCWRIGSRTWLELADEQLDTIGECNGRSACSSRPALTAEGWQLSPVLSLETIRLITMLGGRVERDLCGAWLPMDRVPALVERINPHTLHAGPKECLDSAGQLAQELSRAAAPARQPWRAARQARPVGSCSCHATATRQRRDADVELRLRVVTFPAREFGRRRLGARRMTEIAGVEASAVMDLGEAVQTAVERELPLLLSTEAAGHLKDSIRVGRMKGRPGALTITSSDGLSATTRRVVAEQAIAELRALKRAGAK